MTHFDSLHDTGDLVAGELIGNHDVAWCQRGGKELLDVSQEGIIVGRAIMTRRPKLPDSFGLGRLYLRCWDPGRMHVVKLRQPRKRLRILRWRPRRLAP